MANIVLVEDDNSIRELVTYALNRAEHTATGFTNFDELEKYLSTNDADMFILDIMLSGKTGMDILKWLKDSRFKDVPVMMLTAKGDEYDKVIALDLGADDYVVKPFGVMELMSRINALLRRAGKKENTTSALSYGDIKLDDGTRQVSYCDKEVVLTYKEFELLKLLMINKGLVITREKFMDTIWGYDFEGESRTVDMHIKTLRQKLGAGGDYIKTVRGVGYQFV